MGPRFLSFVRKTRPLQGKWRENSHKLWESNPEPSDYQTNFLAIVLWWKKNVQPQFVSLLHNFMETKTTRCKSTFVNFVSFSREKWNCHPTLNGDDFRTGSCCKESDSTHAIRVRNIVSCRFTPRRATDHVNVDASYKCRWKSLIDVDWKMIQVKTRFFYPLNFFLRLRKFCHWCNRYLSQKLNTEPRLHHIIQRRFSRLQNFIAYTRSVGFSTSSFFKK